MSLLKLYDQIRKVISADELSDTSSEKLLENIFLKSRKVEWDKVFSQISVSGSDVSEESCAKLRDAGTKFFQVSTL
jgi:hypothetical protein